MRKSFAALILCLLNAGQVYAAPDQGALAAFVQGEYEHAANIAAAKGGAENLALAARALNADAYLQSDDKVARKLAKQALEYAEIAIEADHALVEAHLQAAISLAQRGSRMAALRAFFLGIAGRAREELDSALACEPSNAWALSSSAAWHLEVARRVGEGRYGSDSSLGYQQFAKARASDPDNLLIAYECALRLLAFDKPEWRTDGLNALFQAAEGRPTDAFERAIQERAVKLLAAVKAGREAERAFIDVQP
ncbi:hypothetical protein [Hyphococcus sp.]|uniref:hypothetical protein n=1 Tax=Hyphococcus sp. TaxID=2038636 RepID=UPI002081EA98|nr:MAG: hypothetical protein DHS20C04_28550 [Marinicaulis sp.]